MSLGFGTLLFVLYFILAENGPLGASQLQVLFQCADDTRRSVEYTVQWQSISSCSISVYSLTDIPIQQENVWLTSPLISSSLACLELSCHFGIHFCFSLSDYLEATSPGGMSGTNSPLKTLKRTPHPPGSWEGVRNLCRGSDPWDKARGAPAVCPRWSPVTLSGEAWRLQRLVCVARSAAKDTGCYFLPRHNGN